MAVSLTNAHGHPEDGKTVAPRIETGDGPVFEQPACCTGSVGGPKRPTTATHDLGFDKPLVIRSKHAFHAGQQFIDSGDVRRGQGLVAESDPVKQVGDFARAARQVDGLQSGLQ